jgi:hypothetical protein
LVVGSVSRQWPLSVAQWVQVYTLCRVLIYTYSRILGYGHSYVLLH